ncbi:hypothetical protein RHMOL_Rhmol13G0099100 [Rhododendron molle]|uniref:Uncharacterized protein n=1 Tax=Rhododendron molle TaxID=49168 RepID=A0ACC0L5J6_RHOML|nr:hypothetical protein RHMOL_Rhmol13G0099100 [Rhododendron molle]
MDDGAGCSCHNENDSSCPICTSWWGEPPTLADMTTVNTHQEGQNSNPFNENEAQRRTNTPFTIGEVQALVQGVQKHGLGRWQKIKVEFFGNGSRRTRQNLRIGKAKARLESPPNPKSSLRQSAPFLSLLHDPSPEFISLTCHSMSGGDDTPADRKVISLKLLVDKARNRVIFVESDHQFVDTLLSFLTLPIVSAVRLLGPDSTAVMAGSTAACLSIFRKLGIDDGNEVEERTLEFGELEVVTIFLLVIYSGAIAH